MLQRRLQVQYDQVVQPLGLYDNPDLQFTRPVYPDTTTRRHNPAIMRGVFVTDPTSMTQSETITLDKWWQPTEQPQIRRRYFPAQQTTGAIDPTALTLKETVNLDKWFQPTYAPYRQRRDINRYLGWSVTDPQALIGPCELLGAVVSNPTIQVRGVNLIPSLYGTTLCN